MLLSHQYTLLICDLTRARLRHSEETSDCVLVIFSSLV